MCNKLLLIYSQTKNHKQIFPLKIFLLLIISSIFIIIFQDFDPFLDDILAIDSAMSELHPVFHSSPPQNFRRGRMYTDSNLRTPGPELSFGFLPINPKTSSLNNEQGSVQKFSSGPNRSHQNHFEPKPEATHQTFSHRPNVLRHGRLVAGESRFETDSRRHRFTPDSSRNVREYSSGVSNQPSKLDHGMESVRSPTTYSRHEVDKVRNPTRPTENTFNHYYRRFYRNSHPENNRNNIRQIIQGHNDNNLGSQRPGQTYLLKDNPTYSHPVAGGSFHSLERKVHQNNYDIRETTSDSPPKPGPRTRTMLLFKTPSLVTTERPSSAPFNSRGFRMRPQHVSQQSEIEHSSTPRIPSVIRKPSDDPRHRVKHVDFLVSIPNSSVDNDKRLTHSESLSGLEAQHSHRLEQSDRNLYYKNDPFLDITEVYSHRPGSFDSSSKSSILENKNQLGTTSPSSGNKKFIATKDSKPPNLNNKVYPAIIERSKSAVLPEIKNHVVVKDSKPSITLQTNTKDRNSSISEYKTHRNIGTSSPVSFSSSVSMTVNRKAGRKPSAKMTLKK